MVPLVNVRVEYRMVESPVSEILHEIFAKQAEKYCDEKCLGIWQGIESEG